MSYEIDPNGAEIRPYQRDGYSLSLSDDVGQQFKKTLYDSTLEDAFHDPSSEHPMEASKFLSFLNLSPIVRGLEVYYKDLNHFHYPIEAMLRTMIYQRLAGLRHTTQLESRLRNSPSVARNLGFSEGPDGTTETPDRRTLDHFVWKRLGKAGTNAILSLAVIDLRRRLACRGIDLGKRIAVDSTPL